MCSEKDYEEFLREERARIDAELAPARTWHRDSFGGITDGQGWEIHRDPADMTDDVTRPISLWRRGEYVGNYPTVSDAKADAHPVEDD